MFVVNDDMSIYLTRGDTAIFSVTADNNGKNYVFQPGDVVRIKVTEKKACENVMFQKDFPVTEEAEKVDILLTEEETKIGEVISKPTDYWYEIELNPYTNPQTIVGYDEDGAKILRLFPEGIDLEPTPIEPTDIPVVDNALSLTSDRPVQNQAIARAITGLGADIKYVRESGSERMATIEGKITAEANRRSEDVLRLENDIAVERARINNLAANTGEQTEGNAELIDIRVGVDGTTYSTSGEAVRGQIKKITDLIGADGVDLLQSKGYTPDVYYAFWAGDRRTDSDEWNTLGNGLLEKEGDTIYITCNPNLTNNDTDLSGAFMYCFYDANKTYISGSQSTIVDKKGAITFPDNVKYFALSFSDRVLGNFIVSYDQNALGKPVYDLLKEVKSDVDALKGESILNELDGAVIHDNEWISYTGGVHSDENFKRTDNIPVESGSTIVLTKGMAQFCYFSGSTYVSGEEIGTLFASKEFVVPSGCDNAQFTIDKTYENANTGVYKCTLEEYNAVNGTESHVHAYTVDKTGVGTHTSLSVCVLEACEHMDSVIYVNRGTYDIIEEFRNFYGADFWSNPYPNEGLVLKNRVHLIFSPDSEVVFNYDGSNAWVRDNFSPFNAGEYGFTLENATIKCTNARYCVHDERWMEGDFYTNKYVNCSMKNQRDNADGYGQCIGGGLGANGNIVIENCVFENADNEFDRLVTFHNSPLENAKSSISVTGCYFKGAGTYTTQWFGASTKITTSKLSGNSFGTAPYTRQENSDYNNVNVEILAWNNEIRN